LGGVFPRRGRAASIGGSHMAQAASVKTSLASIPISHAESMGTASKL
jgi:hypothetical protein